MPGKISKVTGIASKRNETEKPPKKSTKVRRISGESKVLRIKRVSGENKSKMNTNKKIMATKKVSDSSTNSKNKSEVINGSLAESRTGKIYIGYHASSAGGVHNAITSTAEIGAECLALFLRPQRTWSAPPLKPEAATQFKDLKSSHNIATHMILPHGSYLLNLGSPEVNQREKSLNVLVDELQRCQELGIRLFNIHPGSSCGKISRDECVSNIATGINAAHKETEGSDVKIVLENMSCQGHTIGGDLRELKQIIDQVDDKTRVGVCLDTCHAMAAGYDLSTEEGFNRLLTEFEEFVGWEWLVGCHLNDSKGPAGCHRDRHENIGKGTIGVEGFRRIVNCPHFTDIPLILETPLNEELGNKGYQEEIELLISLIKN